MDLRFCLFADGDKEVEVASDLDTVESNSGFQVVEDITVGVVVTKVVSRLEEPVFVEEKKHRFTRRIGTNVSRNVDRRLRYETFNVECLFGHERMRLHFRYAAPDVMNQVTSFQYRGVCCRKMSCSTFLLLFFCQFLIPGDSRFIVDPVTQNICAECSQILQMSSNLISSRDAKESVYETLRSLCRHLPDQQVSECEANVKMYLPKLLMQTPSHLKSEANCATFGLCPANREVSEVPRVDAETASGVRSSSDKFNPVCSLCVMVIKKLETLLPQNMTEDALMKLMGEVCDLIPESYEKQCDDFLDKYGVEIVDFLLSSAAPHTICALLHVCLFQDTAATDASVPSDCEFCRTLAVLGRLHLSPNSSLAQTSTFLQSVCQLHPHAIPKCKVFTNVYSSQLLPVLRKQVKGQDPCESADLCVSNKKAEPLGQNLCTWGPSYWCRDVETARKCRNLGFCERHVWRKNP